jgi:phosphatidylserine/phosphatidylglycerophosphate/cardiolipin synthase-like enzyme
MERDAPHIPFARSGTYPIRSGNAVRPLVDGEPAFRRICEAVEDARESVWVTVAFLQRDVQMPDGRGTFFDVLDRARARGIDVRVLFWRSPEQEREQPGIHFSGTAEERAWLLERESRFLARWDALPGTLCQHQKSWLVDAGRPGEVAFVGGINLNHSSIVSPGHAPRPHGNTHDVYVEVRGPGATDVHHNFVQRWNGASERTRENGVWPAGNHTDDLDFPRTLSPAAGTIPVQISRTVGGVRYTDGTPPPGGEPFAIAGGEKSILEQYVAAIDAAEHSIYVEDQAIGSPKIIGRLDAALGRGVEVVFLVPVNAHPAFVEARKDERLAPFFERLHALGRYENFGLVGIASPEEPGPYHDIYVHAKIMLVDDGWATIGSTNVADRSFHGDTELNASFWDAATVRELRRELLHEHLAIETAEHDDVAAMRLYREVARKNADRRARGEPLEGLAFEIDPERYGL